MNPDQIPDLPNLLTQQEFERNSGAWTAFAGRSAAIQGIATSIGSYHAERQAYVQSRDAFLRQPTSQNFAALTGAFNKARKSHEGLRMRMSQWGPNAHDARGATQGVQDLWNQLQQGAPDIDTGTRMLQGASMSLGSEPLAPKVNHQIWVGGLPPQAVISNAQHWRATGHEVNLWTDRNNLLNNVYRKASSQPSTGESQQDQAIAARHLLWDKADEQQRLGGFDARLVARQPHYQQQLEQAQQQLSSLQIQGVQKRDVSELFAPQSPPQGKQALSQQDRNKLQLAYQREMGLRFNLAAGSDLLRPIILHDNPGIYTDYDVAPPVKGMPGLVNTWNGVVAQRLNARQQAPRNERLSTTNPDYNLIERQREKLDPHKKFTPEPIPVTGNARLRIEPYQYLQRAVEEHLSELETGVRSNGVHRQALAGYADQYDPEQRMMREFDSWRSKTTRLDDAFEPIPDVRVPANSFRALSTSGAFGEMGSMANSNQVLASSTAGAEHLAEYARHLVKNTNQKYALRNSEKDYKKYQMYMDDSPGNSAQYESDTLYTTGPAAVGEFFNAKKIKPGDTSVQLPHSHLGNFTSDETKSTWLRRPEVPQQRGEGSRQSNAANPEQPRNREPRQPREPHTTEKHKGLGKIFRK